MAYPGRYILDLTCQLTQALDHNYDVINLESVMAVISALEGTFITKEQLETTRLAKYINQLRRRTKNDQLARRAKTLLKKWREMVGIQHQQQQSTEESALSNNSVAAIIQRSGCNKSIYSNLYNDEINAVDSDVKTLTFKNLIKASGFESDKTFKEIYNIAIASENPDEHKVAKLDTNTKFKLESESIPMATTSIISMDPIIIDIPDSDSESNFKEGIENEKLLVEPMDSLDNSYNEFVPKTEIAEKKASKIPQPTGSMVGYHQCVDGVKIVDKNFDKSQTNSHLSEMFALSNSSSNFFSIANDSSTDHSKLADLTFTGKFQTSVVVGLGQTVNENSQGLEVNNNNNKIHKYNCSINKINSIFSKYTDAPQILSSQNGRHLRNDCSAKNHILSQLYSENTSYKCAENNYELEENLHHNANFDKLPMENFCAKTVVLNYEKSLPRNSNKNNGKTNDIVPRKRGRKRGSKGVDSMIALESNISSKILISSLVNGSKKVKTTKELFAEMQKETFSLEMEPYHQYNEVDSVESSEVVTNLHEQSYKRDISTGVEEDYRSEYNTSKTYVKNLVPPSTNLEQVVDLVSINDCTMEDPVYSARRNSVIVEKSNLDQTEIGFFFDMELKSLQLKLLELIKNSGRTPITIDEIENENLTNRILCSCKIFKLSDDSTNISLPAANEESKFSLKTDVTVLKNSNCSTFTITKKIANSEDDSEIHCVSKTILEENSFNPKDAKMKKRSIFDLDFDDDEDPLIVIKAQVEAKSNKNEATIITNNLLKVEDILTDSDEYSIRKPEILNSANENFYTTSPLSFDCMNKFKTEYYIEEDSKCPAKEYYCNRINQISEFHISSLHDFYIDGINGNWDEATLKNEKSDKMSISIIDLTPSQLCKKKNNAMSNIVSLKRKKSSQCSIDQFTTYNDSRKKRKIIYKYDDLPFLGVAFPLFLMHTNSYNESSMQPFDSKKYLNLFCKDPEKAFDLFIRTYSDVERKFQSKSIDFTDKIKYLNIQKKYNLLMKLYLKNYTNHRNRQLTSFHLASNEYNFNDEHENDGCTILHTESKTYLHMQDLYHYNRNNENEENISPLLQVRKKAITSKEQHNSLSHIRNSVKKSNKSIEDSATIKTKDNLQNEQSKSNIDSKFLILPMTTGTVGRENTTSIKTNNVKNCKRKKRSVIKKRRNSFETHVMELFHPEELTVTSKNGFDSEKILNLNCLDMKSNCYVRASSSSSCESTSQSDEEELLLAMEGFFNNNIVKNQMKYEITKDNGINNSNKCYEKDEIINLVTKNDQELWSNAEIKEVSENVDHDAGAPIYLKSDESLICFNSINTNIDHSRESMNLQKTENTAYLEKTFKEWHEVLQLKSYNNELLTILPYVVLE